MNVLIIQPLAANYFYDVQASRLADALRSIGCTVWLESLASFQVQPYDHCLLVNVAEIIDGYTRRGQGSRYDALRCFRLLDSCCRQRHLVLMECARTPWYAENRRWCRALGIGSMLDLGFHDQRHYIKRGEWSRYRFLFNGLTAAERLHAHDMHSHPQDRPIPWVFIGTYSQQRARIAWRLVTDVDCRGALYLRNPETGPIGWSGPHFNYEQFLQNPAGCSVQRLVFAARPCLCGIRTLPGCAAGRDRALQDTAESTASVFDRTGS